MTGDSWWAQFYRLLGLIPSEPAASMCEVSLDVSWPGFREMPFRGGSWLLLWRENTVQYCFLERVGFALASCLSWRKLDLTTALVWSASLLVSTLTPKFVMVQYIVTRNLSRVVKNIILVILSFKFKKFKVIKAITSSVAVEKMCPFSLGKHKSYSLSALVWK